MRVRITEGRGWHALHVGKVFDVYEVSQDGVRGGKVYYVDPPRKGRRGVSEDCCEIINTGFPGISDAVEHPDHYTRGKFEVIEVIEQVTSGYTDGFVAHCVGTATKYQHRAPFKHASPLEDLRKAAKYLEFAIAYLEQQSEAE